MKRVLDAMVAISSDLNLPTVLTSVVEAACEIAEARYGALGVIGSSDADGLYLAEFITEGIDKDAIAAIGHNPLGKGILGLLIRQPAPLRLHDLSAHPESYGFPTNHPPMRSFLGVPIRIREQVFGNLYLTEKKDGGDFNEEDEYLMIALAGAAGVAIENARLQTQVKNLAVMHDRDRIARDLHDTVIQRLFATGLALQGLSRITPDPTVSDRIQQSVDDLDDVIRDIRGAIFALQSHAADQTSFRVALLTAATEATDTLGFEPHVHFDGPVDTVIESDKRDQLLIVLREMLTNVAKHANASSADVYVKAAKEISLSVVDNGSGPGPIRRESNGLANLSARARSLGGDFTLSPNEGGGSNALWRIPRVKTPS